MLKFKYDIHCQMAMENKTFSSSFPQLIANLTGTMYEVCICTRGKLVED